MDIHLFERYVLPSLSETFLSCLVAIANSLWLRISLIALSPTHRMASEQERGNLVNLSLHTSALLMNVSGRDGEPIVIPDERRAGLIPCTQHYPVEEVMLDLLHMSAICLKKLSSHFASSLTSPLSLVVATLFI